MNHVTVGVLACIIELLQIGAFHWWWRRLAFTLGADDLTGLRNRHGLHDALRGLRSVPGVLLLDLSGFKAVNDRFGHDTGDAMLRGVAARLTELALRGTVIGRLGGDEFVLLLPHATTRRQLIEAAEAVRAAVSRALPIPDLGNADSRPAPVVSCVIGLALPGALPDPDKPFRAADIALYHARHHGLPYAIYEPGMVHPASADRHGSRLRDRRPMPPPVVFDTAAYDLLVHADDTGSTGGTSTVADDDRITARELAGLLAPDTHSFGTDVADLVDRCANLGVLRWAPPITAVCVEPTVNGEFRDGGLRVLVTVGDALTLASPRWRPDRSLTGHDDPAAAVSMVLHTVVSTACQLYAAYTASATPRHADR